MSFLRTFSTKTTPHVIGLPGRYATALFKAAGVTIENDIPNLRKIMTENEELFKSPLASKGEKVELIKKIVASNKISSTAQQFLNVLAENKRLDITPQILQELQVLITSAKGETNVVITSAKKLDEKQLSTLKTSLAKFADLKDTKIKIENKVNAAILGGLIVDLGDKSVDMSIASRINKLNMAINEAA